MCSGAAASGGHFFYWSVKQVSERKRRNGGLTRSSSFTSRFFGPSFFLEREQIFRVALNVSRKKVKSGGEKERKREREMFLESSFRREEEKSKEGRRRTLSVPNSRSIPFGT